MDDLRAVIQNREKEISGEVWGEEEDCVLSRADLARFLLRAVRRSKRRGLPAARQMREGDVYWIVSEAPVRRPDGGVGPDRTRTFLAPYDEIAVEVWDATAAARLAVKDAHFRVIAKQAARQLLSVQPTREQEPTRDDLEARVDEEEQPEPHPTMRRIMEQMVQNEEAVDLNQ